jgi:hypothetical protein
MDVLEADIFIQYRIYCGNLLNTPFNPLHTCDAYGKSEEEAVDNWNKRLGGIVTTPEKGIQVMVG